MDQQESIYFPKFSSSKNSNAYYSTKNLNSHIYKENSNLLQRVKQNQLKKLRQQLKKQMIEMDYCSVSCSKKHSHIQKIKINSQNNPAINIDKKKSACSLYDKVQQQRLKKLEQKRLQLRKKQIEKQQHMKLLRQKEKINRQYFQNEKLIKKTEVLKRKQKKQQSDNQKISNSIQDLLFKDRKIKELKLKRQQQSNEVNKLKKQIEMKRNQILKEMNQLKNKGKSNYQIQDIIKQGTDSIVSQISSGGKNQKVSDVMKNKNVYYTKQTSDLEYFPKFKLKKPLKFKTQFQQFKFEQL